MNGLNAMSFDNINNTLHDVYKTQAEKSMSRAAEDVHLNSDKNPREYVMSCLVRWVMVTARTCILNGLVTAISKNKCVDVAIFSKYCRGCAMCEHRKNTNPEGYKNWKVEHECSANHDKSSGAMEGAGAAEIFKRSIKRHKLVYNEYLGDGDTSSFKDVVNAETLYRVRHCTAKVRMCRSYSKKD